MILNALCEYYDMLANDGSFNISKYGYEKTDYYYTIIITEEGELFNIISHVNDRKKDKPKSAIMPKNMKISGIASSPVCDNLTYLLGVMGKKKDKELNERKFLAAKDLHLNLFRSGLSREAKAIVKFFEKWDIDKAWENEHILSAAVETGNDAFKGNGVFKLIGETKCFHECEEIINLWEAENNKKDVLNNKESGQCAIIGDNLPISRSHGKLSGVRGAQSTGAALISFNEESYESYGFTQSNNSRVSLEAEFKYTTILQYLLDNRDYKLYLGDDTTVFWASSPKKEFLDLAFGLLDGVSDDNDENENTAKVVNENDNESTRSPDKKITNLVKSILKSGSQGIITQDPNFDVDVKYFILGLAPNAGRISVRYFYQNTLTQFCDNIHKYHLETQIFNADEKYTKNYIRSRDLLFSTVSTNSSDKKVNPLLGGAVMRAIITGQKYPQILFNQLLLRIKTERSVNQVRASAIKAILIRNKNFKEINMYLNEESKNSAYNLGRVFAYLEIIQKNAAGGSLNATIKDKYFATACANPAIVFPTLLKLAQHHLAKIEGNYLNIELGKCLALIENENFPKTQSMEQQGSFILGYYQQIQKIYTKKEKVKDGETTD
ncbi:MAG: type I-C CRISPR-associated protein Cas8c/Csd1 [Candidatus Cloacimonetes bacterium]|nr:type I-C CRISPR-associated protein Cas8c/Csd1 [Candidatus Cloacimonadota bacterium]